MEFKKLDNLQRIEDQEKQREHERHMLEMKLELERMKQDNTRYSHS